MSEGKTNPPRLTGIRITNSSDIQISNTTIRGVSIGIEVINSVKLVFKDVDIENGEEVAKRIAELETLTQQTGLTSEQIGAILTETRHKGDLSTLTNVVRTASAGLGVAANLTQIVAFLRPFI